MNSLKRCCSCGISVSINDADNKNNRQIGIEYNDRIYCLPCQEILFFMGGEVVPKQKEIELQVKTESKYPCIKCGVGLTLQMPKCEECNWSHPLLNRVSKKSKRRKN